ncbi:MAG: alpha-1,2-fucosyltransferase [Lachnospiraceae bacterium]|nr:alpha-1,2-fucosyltransferase [Lachnospiraceae bacterium]
MNIIRMTGGLGNQMFQYALWLKYRSLGIDAKFEDFTEYDNRDNKRPISLWVFGIDYPKCNLEEFYEYTDSKPGILAKIKRHTLGRKSREYIESTPNFDENILKKDDSYITGYFQSEKYFEDIKDEVIEAFSFNDDVILKAIEIYNDDFENVASIHIRRGDYLNLQEQYGNICTEKYYDNAINLLVKEKNVKKFLIFSNDVQWAAKWSERYTSLGFEMVIIKGTSEDTGYLDMYLMSCCQHNIIANSSFSWWGAYLNRNPEKMVIAPKIWINGKNQTDIYTKDMVRL